MVPAGAVGVSVMVIGATEATEPMLVTFSTQVTAVGPLEVSSWQDFSIFTSGPGAARAEGPASVAATRPKAASPMRRDAESGKMRVGQACR